MEPIDGGYSYGVDVEHAPLGGAGDEDDDELMYDGNEPIDHMKDQPMRIGDSNFYRNAETTDHEEILGEASWEEVCRSCCCHTVTEWLSIFVGVGFLLSFLYFFLLGLGLLSVSAKIVGGCKSGDLIGGGNNPISALMVGLLITALFQSSSTTTSIVVSLVGSGSLAIRQGIYIIMGANIGTSVTNNFVAMGQMGDKESLERAFAGATVHDMFNILTVGVLLPLEAMTGYLYYLTKAMVHNVETREGDSWQGPIKKFVDPLEKLIIIANKDLISSIASGDSCDRYYPVRCADEDNPTYDTCYVGLIQCDKSTNKCPAFFQPTAKQHDDLISGGVCFALGLIILIASLIGMVAMLQKLMMGVSTRIIYKATNINGYASILIGAGITLMVQSSSITTSTLTPLVGMGVLQLEQMYPLTLGANLGTTVTAILAALVADSIDSLQVALAHLMFNVSGVLLFYPIPFMRRIPLNVARKLGKVCVIWRPFPVVYIAVMFFIAPLSFLGLSTLFEERSKGYTVLGVGVLVILAGIISYYLFIWQFREGRESCLRLLEHRQRKRECIERLPNDMEYIMAKLTALSEHTGLPEDDDERGSNDEQDHDEHA